MADKKISQLTALAAANLASSTDVLAIVDTSATETKKIVAQDLINGVLNVASAVGIGRTPSGYTLDITTSGNALRMERSGVEMGGFISGSNSFWGTITNHPFLFMTNSTERMRLDSSGNLGLGTSSFPSDTNFTVLGDFKSGFYRNVTSGDRGYFLNIGAKTSGGFADGGYILGAVESGDATGYLAFGTRIGGSTTERARITSGGDFGIGTSSPGARLDVRGAATNFAGLNVINSESSSGVQTTSSIRLGITNSIGVRNTRITAIENSVDSNSVNLAFFTNEVNGLDAEVERARITSDGKFLLNTTSTVVSGDEIFGAIGTNGLGVKSTGGASSFVAGFWNNATSGDNVFVNFYTETGGTNRGSINYNRTGGLVAYNTTSDYRAKDVYGLLDDSGETIDALKVYRGKMHGATMERPMLIAHEAQEIAPYAVTGEKDAVNDDGTPKFQQMDTSSLVPLLIAEIQSLRSRVSALEAK